LRLKAGGLLITGERQLVFKKVGIQREGVIFVRSTIAVIIGVLVVTNAIIVRIEILTGIKGESVVLVRCSIIINIRVFSI